MTNIPKDLTEYLYTMITPTHVGGQTLLVWDIDQYDWLQHEDESIHGIIAQGTPTEIQVKEMDRVLKPGAHAMLIAPDESLSGHKGTIALEEGGFEIRDTICVLDDSEGFSYTAKASRSEREAGCSMITPSQRDEGRKEGNPGGDNPRNRGLSKVANSHPTVKPIGIMEFCLRDLPKGASVLDPFMGSGTTMIACLRTGHNGIGIEKEKEYINIAHARIAHQNESDCGWNRSEIDSEAEIKEAGEAQPMSLDDLFGF